MGLRIELLITALLILCGSFPGTPTLAQTTTTGTIEGIVTDSNGAVVPAVKVTVTSPNLIRAQSATTNDEGRYRILNLPPTGTGQKQLTADAGNNSRPSVSYDGRYVVFMSDRTGTNHIWRIDIDGSNATQLTNGGGESDPQCLPTGEWVLYQLTSGKGGIGKVRIAGGETVQIIDKKALRVAISPDGKWIASAYFQPTVVKIAIYPIEGGEPYRILDLSGYYYVRWTPDGRALAYVDQEDLSNINSQLIDGGPSKQLTNFKSDLIFSFAWSRDGKQLALARGTVNKDVVLISNFKDQQ